MKSGYFLKKYEKTRCSIFIIWGLISFFFFLTQHEAWGRRVKELGNSISNLKYIYGPVSSWRLGISLGIDPISQAEKICSFECFYCQVGPTDILTTERQIFVKTDDILEELKYVLANLSEEVNYITLAGRGEPTLAGNLGEIVRGVKKITNIPIAILTNATLLGRKDVQEDLKEIDFVIAKIDAYDEDSFRLMNNPHEDLSFTSVIEGIREFRKTYAGRMGIQIMFTQENKQGAEKIAQIVKELGLKPGDQIQLNTPLRPRVDSYLEEPDMRDIKRIFEEFLAGMGLEIVMVYEAEHKEVSPLGERETLQRRGAVK